MPARRASSEGPAEAASVALPARADTRGERCSVIVDVSNPRWELGQSELATRAPGDDPAYRAHHRGRQRPLASPRRPNNRDGSTARAAGSSESSRPGIRHAGEKGSFSVPSDPDEGRRSSPSTAYGWLEPIRHLGHAGCPAGTTERSTGPIDDESGEPAPSCRRRQSPGL